MSILTIPQGHNILTEERRDPITGERLLAGNRVVVCQCSQCGPSGMVFLEDTWAMAKGDHEGGRRTARSLPEPFHFGRGGSRSHAGGRRPASSAQPAPRPGGSFSVRPSPGGQARFRMGPVSAAPPPPPVVRPPAPPPTSTTTAPQNSSQSGGCKEQFWQGCGCLFWGMVALAIFISILDYM